MMGASTPLIETLRPSCDDCTSFAEKRQPLSLIQVKARAFSRRQDDKKGEVHACRRRRHRCRHHQRVPGFCGRARMGRASDKTFVAGAIREDRERKPTARMKAVQSPRAANA
jgi:hypothetical protein